MFSLILAAALLTDPVATPVTLPSGPAPLHGTLLTPGGPTRAAALIIAGSGPTDANALAAARPDARLTIWEGVNHLLKIAPADRAANIATYRDPNLALAPGVVGDVAGFILQPHRTSAD
jgi:hypothetical protein